MNTTLRTCNHVYDTGGTCSSVAAKDSDYCTFHLRYRARLLRTAQARARMQRFDLKLPPIESMSTVLSAVNQLVEAVAADMIDLKRADFLLKSLRFAAQALKSSDKWLPSVYHSDQQAPAINFAAEYGLPDDLDPNTLPEVAFPSPPAPAASETRPWPPATDHSSDLDPMPTVAYCKHGPGCPEHTIRADYPETPETVELCEVFEARGSDAMGACYKRQQHNRQRRYSNTARKRYSAIALERNLRLAAERLAERKLAEQAAASQEVGCPIPPSVGGVGTFPDATKKPPATVNAAQPDQKEAKSIA